MLIWTSKKITWFSFWPTLGNALKHCKRPWRCPKFSERRGDKNARAICVNDQKEFAYFSTRSFVSLDVPKNAKSWCWVVNVPLSANLCSFLQQKAKGADAKRRFECKKRESRLVRSPDDFNGETRLKIVRNLNFGQQVLFWHIFGLIIANNLSKFSILAYNKNAKKVDCRLALPKKGRNIKASPAVLCWVQGH